MYPSFGVTMRAGQRQHLLAGLDAAFPGEELARRYRSRFGSNYYCPSPRAKQLWHSCTAACQKHGLLYQMPDIIRAHRQGKKCGQLSLFD